MTLRVLCFATMLFICSGLSAQRINNLVVFCNEGEKFVLILNGQRYNDSPATTVKAPDLVLTTYKVKVIFENKKINDLNTTLTFYKTNKECVFGLTKKNRKKYTMDYVSATDIIPVVPPSTSEQTSPDTYASAPYTPTDPVTPTNPTVPNSTNSISLNTGNLNIGVNQDGSIRLGTRQGNVNLNTKDKSGNVVINNGSDGVVIHKAPAKTGCPVAMAASEFETIRKNVSNQTSDANRLLTATALLEGNCFLTSQVKQLLLLLTEESSKLELAKSAYSYTSDITNYHQLKDAFTKEDLKKELTSFIKEQKGN